MSLSDADDASRANSVKTESTKVTTPDHEEDGEDIWGSDDHASTHNANGTGEILSDLPTVKRQHMTDGYREGLSIGKAQVMQKGFDEGYPIGVAIALRVGKILGCLEGYVAAKGLSSDEKQSLQNVLKKAQDELAMTALNKPLNDEIIAETKGIPDCIEQVLRRWEEKLVDHEQLST